MAENLTIRLTDQKVEWLILDEVSGIVRLRGEGNFTEFADLIRDVNWQGETRILIGGERVLLTSALVPSRQQRQILQAVPYAVEEELAVDVGQCHFALGSRNSDNQLEVVVINHAWLQEILQDLDEIGLAPNFLSVDLLMIPGHQTSQDTNVMIDNERVHILTAHHQGITTSAKQLALVVSLLDEEDQETLHIHVHPDEQSNVQLALSEIETAESTSVNIHELIYRPFETLCREFDSSSINLLQGDFKVKEVKSSKGSGWRAAAILAACTFITHIVFTLGQGIYMDVQASNYAEEAGALYKELFPEDRNVRDIRRRWTAHLGGGSTESRLFMSMFEETAASISGSNLVLQNVNYNESRGDLILQLVAASREQLVSFAESLSSGGLQAEIGNISQDEDSVRGSIKIRSVGSR
jgi:general secretion pathway protein L